ncbi:MAG: hypothetical protein RI897_1904 [Verrucomicrobiota bacterium]
MRVTWRLWIRPDTMKSRSIDGVEEVRIPRATYRVQFHAGFTFRDALGLVPYWARLGISDLYASPVARARPGSMHGYDVCDPNELNPELGTWVEFEQLCELLQEHGMGLVLDIVPNHLGIGHQSNRWWWDVLEWGERSRYAVFFDIDWGAGRLMVPVLGAAYGEVLGRGEIRLERCDRGVEVVYYEHRFPLSPEGWDCVLGELEGVGCGGVAGLRELLGALIAGGAGLGKGDGVAWGEWKAGVCGFLAGDEVAAQKLDALLAGWNSAADGGAALDEVLQLQSYRLAWWRLGVTELNYRRFFDVTHLAGLRVEDPEVFLLSHELVARLWHYGHLTGLRIDHPDGLWDPAGYLRHLQRLVTEAVPEGDSPLVPDGRGRVMYVVVEKILSAGEQLSRQWPVHGTTGYDVLNQLNALWVPMESAEVFTRIHGDFCGGVVGYEDEVRRNKRRVLESTLVSEWESLVGRLHALLSGTREGGDYERGVIREAVVELLSVFPVYRTYTDARRERLEGQELAQVDQAVREALRGKAGEVADVLQLLGRILRLEWPGLGGGGRRQAREWVMRFQQLTGPVMAKGLEDTTFYSYTRLSSLNEVGGHPERFGISVREFHEANRDRLANWPGSMVATATHDTKRGEDLRVRIDVLAEVPEVWERALIKFSTINGGHYRVVKGGRIPSASDEYLFYQTLVGLGVGSSGVVVGEELLGRVEAYMLKAVREAKVRTSWVEPNEEYERGLVEFCRRVLVGETSAAFLRELGKLSGMAVWFGRFNSLGQVLLKLTIPGVPDMYQGTEFWDLSLVDPDNRRPVDYRVRQDALKDLEGLAGRGGKGLAKRVVELLVEGDGAVAKLWVMWRVLSMRKRESRLWLRGEYEELVVRGHLSGHVVAFARCCGRRAFVVVVPRCVVGLTGGAERLPVGEEIWGDTGIELPAGWSGDGWVNRLTGEVLRAGNELRVSEVLGRFPAALLVKQVEEGSEV